MVIMQGARFTAGPTPRAARGRWAACLAPMLSLSMSLARPSWSAEPGTAPVAQAADWSPMPFRRARSRLAKSLPDSVARNIPAKEGGERILVINKFAKLLAHYPGASRLLEDERVAAFFVKRPVKAFYVITTIIRHASEGTTDPKKKAEKANRALDVLLDDKVTPVFVKYPDIFADMAKEAHGDTWYSFEKAEDQLESTILAGISLYDAAAIELGRPLDDLRGDEAGRTKYLEGLSSPEKLGLLCSDPSFFDASSNKLLLKWLVQNGKSSDMQKLKEKYSLTDTQAANLAFRILNNGLVDDFIPAQSREHDTGVFLAALMGTQAAKNGIYGDSFNPRYFYVLANSAEKISARFPWLADVIKRRRERLGGTAGSQDTEKIRHALTYAHYLITKKTNDYELARFGAERAAFNPRNYMVGGKVAVVQVFDKDDTGNTHWHMSNTWFGAKYGKPRTGRSGELIYETGNLRLVHFMGATKAANQKFVRSWVAEHDASIITLRADVLHLEENMPYDVFGNRAGRYLFINGVCGGAASDSSYVAGNPNTALDIISYSSTGRGQVTNTLLELLLDRAGPAPYQEIVDAGRGKIVAMGGNQFTIMTPSAGQGLLSYVNMKTAGSRE